MIEFLENFADNVYFIALIFALLIFFITMYLIKRNKYRKLTASRRAAGSETDLEFEWAAQYLVLKTQLDLISELSPAGLMLYDYRAGTFDMDENGRRQLGLPERAPLSLGEFEEVIHPDDAHIYDEWFKCVDIRSASISDNPYILRARPVGAEEYGEYLFRIKPVYSDYGNILTLICAFIDTKEM